MEEDVEEVNSVRKKAFLIRKEGGSLSILRAEGGDLGEEDV